MTTYGYIRVSTDKQNTENQKFEIEQYAQKNNLHIDKWVAETISSKKNLEKRKLYSLLKKLKNNDILIATELSRFGRNLFQVMGILQDCMERGSQVWTIKENYKLGENIQSKVLAFAFSLSAEIERNLISQRTKESLLRLKAEGKKLGRPEGSKNKNPQINEKQKEIKELLSRSIPKRKIAQITSISSSTLYRYLQRM